MIYFLVPESGAWGMREYLEFWGRDIVDRVRLLPYEELFEREDLDFGTYVFSGLDQLSPTALEWADHICREIERTDGMRVVNRPGATLKRYDLLSALHDSGLNRFCASRASDRKASLRFPVFIREERGHTGSLTELLQDDRELDRARGELLCKGYDLRDLLVVEFCDTRDEDGWFRRYAAFLVGDRVLPRSIAFSRKWVAKAGTRVMDDRMLAEERDYVTHNPHQGQLKEIAGLARVQYGRIDYAILDGRVQTWEINLNPTIGRSASSTRRRHLPEEVERQRLLAKGRFFEGLRDALLALDTEGAQRASLCLAPNDVFRGKLHADLKRNRLQARRKSSVQAVRNFLRPLEPILRPALAVSSPLIARVRMWLT